MSIAKFAAVAALAIAGVFGSVSSAFAYEAAATSALNVRTGPGTNYAVVGALSANQVVRVTECNASNTWCNVQAANIRGWASARYLRPLGPTQPSRPQPGQPDVGFSINTPGFSVQIGSGNNRPSPSGRVCFYEDYNYSGRSFCARTGEQNRSLDNFWNDRIRSARVEGNTSATVCTGNRFSGRCASIDRSVRNLGMLADNISSYYVGNR